MLSDKLKPLARLAWFLPGFLLWAAFPPMGEHADALFALAPLMWLSRRGEEARTVAKRWFQSGCFFWIATLSWMPAIVKNGGPWPLVALGWFALSAYCAGYFWLYGWLSAKYWNWTRSRGGGRPPGYAWRLLGVLAVEPVLWCGLELVRSRLFGGFAWNQLGVVPVNAGFGGPAALGGVYLCSAAVVLVNGTIAGIAERMWKPERSGFAQLRRFGSAETLLAFSLVFSIYFAASGLQPVRETAGNLKVAMIQRNFPCVFKTREESPEAVYAQLLDKVRLLDPDLAVLSESAMCEFGPVDQQGAVRFAEGVVRSLDGAALLAGGTRFAEGATYNSAALYSPAEGTPSAAAVKLDVYDKVHLVPFGEFIPGDKWLPILQRFAPVGSCTAGELKTLTLDRSGETVLLGAAICFEDVDSAQVRELARRGAQVLCFITNDSWFSQSVEPVQHAWQAVARAVETGLPVVRVGNSGVTGVVSPDGKATWLADAAGKPLVDRQGTMFDRIGYCASGAATTVYVRLGDRPLASLFGLLMLIYGIAFFRRRGVYNPIMARLW